MLGCVGVAGISLLASSPAFGAEEKVLIIGDVSGKEHRVPLLGPEAEQAQIRVTTASQYGSLGERDVEEGTETTPLASTVDWE